MKQSKVSQLLKLIEGTHCMGADGLRDYHAAKNALKAKLGKREPITQLSLVRTALKNHGVGVYLTSDARIRVFRADTREEFYL